MTNSSYSSPARRDAIRNYQTREFIADTLDAARRARQYAAPPTPLDEYERAFLINVFNQSGQNISRWQPMRITSAVPGTAASAIDWYIDNMALNGTLPSGAEIHNICVPIEPIGANGVGLAAMGGLVACPVYFPDANATWIRRCDIEAGQSTLVAQPNGEAVILYADPTALGGVLPGTVDCIVRLQPAVDVTYSGVAVGDIQPNTTGTVNLYQNDSATGYQITAYLNHMEQGLKISDGKEVKVTWYHQEQQWRIDGAECEDNPPTLGQLANGPDPQPTQALTTTPAFINAFDDASQTTFSTPNVTTDAATARITLPDIPNTEVYRTTISGQFVSGSNNNEYVIEIFVNGAPTTPPSLININARQANQSTPYSLNLLVPVVAQSAPQFDLRMYTSAGTDTITWESCIFALEKNLDF